MGITDAHRRAEETNQQDISYRDPSSTGRLAVGDRAPDALVPDTHDYLVDAVFNPTFAESYKVTALDVMNKMRTLSRFRA